MDWEEVCKYQWQGKLTGRIYQYKLDGGFVWYSNDEGINWTQWMHVNGAWWGNYSYSYRQLGPILFTSPQEKVIMKIRNMEKRWATFQEKKRGVA